MFSMTVVRKSTGEIFLPSNANQDLAIFLIFAGLALSFPVRNLIARVYPGRGWIDYLVPLGFATVVLAALMLRFTRKSFRVEERAIAVKNGWFGRTLRYRWEGEPMIRLRSQEEESGKGSRDFWLVNLVDGKRQYVLDRREGHRIESRSLAEALAKQINCPVLEKGESGEMLIPREELDLPFRERVRRHPELLGQEFDRRPDGCSVVEERCQGDAQVYRWKLLSPAMLQEYFTLVFFLVLMGVVPIFPRVVGSSGEVVKFQVSFFNLAMARHDYTYFLVTGIIIALTSFLLFGYRKELRTDVSDISAQDKVWGVPFWSARIPADQLEAIWVRQSARGTHLQLISDACIISGRLACAEEASWLASRIRRFYGETKN